ncbi:MULTISPECIES: TVP38/TMEM64 family protein [unclassified Marinovum]
MLIRISLLIAFGLLFVIAAFPELVGLDSVLPERADMRRWIDAAGALGPVLVVALMTLAVVASPLPSAPIAMVAGAAYGNAFGTVLVVLGAEMGALIAFGLARWLGRPFVERHFGKNVGASLLGSQNTLTFLVFGSRLLPFVSFDMISYVAGLSTLHLWRFALATFAGIIPASFVLVYLGHEAMTGDAGAATWTAILLGGFTAVSVAYAVLRKKRGSDGK